MENFRNRNGLRLSCSYFWKNPDDKRIYIICQTFLSEIFFRYEILIHCLKSNIFRFYFTGQGNSEGSYSFAEFNRDAEDINDAVNFLVSQGYQVEGIIASCKSANDAIIYSAIYGKVKKIVVLAPRFYMNNLPYNLKNYYKNCQKNLEITHSAYGEAYKWTKEMIDDIMRVDMKYYCENAIGNIYIIHGDEDDLVDHTEALEFARELKEKCKGIFILHCDHFFTGDIDDVAEIIQKILDED